MADTATITRRGAFASLGALVSSAAIAIPSVAAVRAQPTSVDHFLATASAEDRIQFHALELAKLLVETTESNGYWKFSTRTRDKRFVLFSHHPHPTFRGVQQDFV